MVCPRRANGNTVSRLRPSTTWAAAFPADGDMPDSADQLDRGVQ